ncbi:MAG: phosphoenolpyruvate hydrolase family protein, partial [Paracoccaceae bacterium]
DDVILLCHGGPISMPEDAAYILKHCNRCDGFYGASSAERLPAETAIRDQIKSFKSLPLKKR